MATPGSFHSRFRDEYLACEVFESVTPTAYEHRL